MNSTLKQNNKLHQSYALSAMSHLICVHQLFNLHYNTLRKMPQVQYLHFTDGITGGTEKLRSICFKLRIGKLTCGLDLYHLGANKDLAYLKGWRK